jgi:hypothetical protein
MDTETLTLLLTFAATSILMVVAMVHFSVAIVAEAEQPTAVKRWGLIYAAAWGVIVMVMVRGAIAADVAWPQALAAVTFAAGGWGTFQAFWVWLWLSLERTNARATGQTVRLTPAKEAICRRAGKLAVGGLIAVALAVIELGFVRALVAEMLAPGHRAIAAALTVAVVGFALLIFGSVRMVLSRGEPMSHAEIEEDLGRTKFGPQGRTGLLRFSRSNYRHFGPAEGAKAEEEISITEMKDVWRSGAWRRDPHWQTVFMMAAGSLMMFFGGFGAAIVAGPPVVKVLCGGALGYATFQLVAAFRRA